MTKASYSERPTRMLVTAAKIWQALSPSKLGLLFVIYNNDIKNQKEISDTIDRTQSTVSSYLQTLETLTPPLEAKQGRYYTVTNTGERVIGLVGSMINQSDSDLDLQSVDWTDETDRNAVEEVLTPLHDSRGMRPFFVLDSLYERNDINGPVGTPHPVRFDDIVRDVETRQDDIGESTNTKQVRRTIKLRFNDTDAADFNEGQVTLTRKGYVQAWVLSEFIRFLKEQEEIGSGGSKNTALSDTEATGEKLDDISTASTEQSDNPHRKPGSTDILQHLPLESPRSGSQSSEERPTVVPVYSLHSAETNGRQSSPPVLPLTAETTVRELTTFVNQLADEYDGDTRLVLDWMVQTESGLYPLSVMDAPSSDLELEM